MILINLGCEGPEGPTGTNIPGVDVVPPTIFMNKPLPFAEVWDEIEISVSAIDNVAIREVNFFIDGSKLFNGYVLQKTEPPYTTENSVETLKSGWHFISARAYDTAGNASDVAPITVWIGHSEDLSGNVEVGYHGSDQSQIWTLPDETNTNAIWTKFSRARTCSLFSVKLSLAAKLSPAALAIIQVWTGEDFPIDTVGKVELFYADFDTVIKDIVVEFSGIELRNRGDFFVMLSFEDETDEDTLFIAADNGIPYWERSGFRTEEGKLEYINSRYPTLANFHIDCMLNYDIEEPDSTNE